jgi:hypothetical protein
MIETSSAKRNLLVLGYHCFFIYTHLTDDQGDKAETLSNCAESPRPLGRG